MGAQKIMVKFIDSLSSGDIFLSFMILSCALLFMFFVIVKMAISNAFLELKTDNKKQLELLNNIVRLLEKILEKVV